MRRQGGYLTVYLSLSLTLILSFILTMVEGARLHAVRMEAECISDIGMNSVLAEFHRELLEQYDLLFVDMSYGSSSAVIENSSEHLRDYLQKNCSRSERGGSFGLSSGRDWLALSVDQAVIREYSLASDYKGNVMKRQALEYMKDSTAEGMALDALGLADKVKSLGLDTRDIAAERESIQAQIDAIELPKQEDEEGEEYEISLSNPADNVNASRGSFTLRTVTGKNASLSGTVIRLEDYISHRSCRSGLGINPDLREPSGILDELMFDCYLLEKCGNYRKEKENSLLKYQVEYLIAGEASDLKNLDKVVKRLLLWREVANVTYILSDSKKCREAEMAALTLTAVMLVPEFKDLVKYSILFAWAYMESVWDVRNLLAGGKAPLMKSGEDWKTSMSDLLFFSGTIPEKAAGGRGLEYEDYLRIMLCLEDGTKKIMRAMDIMEMDIRQTPGNAYFCMDACFDIFLADISISSAFGYQGRIKKRYGYH